MIVADDDNSQYRPRCTGSPYVGSRTGENQTYGISRGPVETRNHVCSVSLPWSWCATGLPDRSAKTVHISTGGNGYGGMMGANAYGGKGYGGMIGGNNYDERLGSLKRIK
jgi:hypothetical protein